MKSPLLAVLGIAQVFGQAASTTAPDLELHASVLKLVELAGVRDQMKLTIPQGMESAKVAMMKATPGLDPRFVDEWARRMKERINVDDYVAAVVRVYEANLSAEDAAELVGLTESHKAGRPVVPSTRLQEKLRETMPAIMGQIVGATTELGAKLGGAIGMELEKEHPEWVKPANRGPAP